MKTGLPTDHETALVVRALEHGKAAIVNPQDLAHVRIIRVVLAIVKVLGAVEVTEDVVEAEGVIAEEAVVVEVVVVQKAETTAVRQHNKRTNLPLPPPLQEELHQGIRHRARCEVKHLYKDFNTGSSATTWLRAIFLHHFVGSSNFLIEPCV